MPNSNEDAAESSDLCKTSHPREYLLLYIIGYIHIWKFQLRCIEWESSMDHLAFCGCKRPFRDTPTPIKALGGKGEGARRKASKTGGVLGQIM